MKLLEGNRERVSPVAWPVAVRLRRRLFRVRMPRKNGEGAVELLGEHGAGKFVRSGQ